MGLHLLPRPISRHHLVVVALQPIPLLPLYISYRYRRCTFILLLLLIYIFRMVLVLLFMLHFMHMRLA